MFNEGKVTFQAEDVRFTTKGGALFAAMLAWPDRPVTIAALGTRALPDAAIERVRLVGGGQVRFTRDEGGLTLNLPPARRGEFVPVVQIDGRGIA